ADEQHRKRSEVAIKPKATDVHGTPHCPHWRPPARSNRPRWLSRRICRPGSRFGSNRGGHHTPSYLHRFAGEVGEQSEPGGGQPRASEPRSAVGSNNAVEAI